MQCTVCNTRSEVDSCVQCHALLCEVCGETCEKCGAMACPEHTKRTSSGHVLCIKCYEKRRARKEAQRRAESAGGASFQELEGKGRHAAEEEEKDEFAALAASGHRATPPWKLSLYTAIAALVFVLLLLLFPGLRRINMGASYFPTSLCVLFITAISAFWAAMGLASKDPEQEQNRGRCLTALGVGVVSVLLAVIAIATDPAKAVEEQNRRIEQEQMSLTPEQRREQTRGVLDQF